MAGQDRMTIEEVVRKVLRDEHADVIRESVRAVAQELMEAEVAELIGAELGERGPRIGRRIATAIGRGAGTRGPGRSSCRSPSCARAATSRAFCSPASAPSRRWSAWSSRRMCAASRRRRVDQLVESLGLRISKSEVSRIAGLLDEQVQAFRERPLEGRYPYLFVDAKVEKVRDGGRVAAQVRGDRARRPRDRPARDHRPGRRRGRDRGVLARVPAQSLVARGLVGVQLAISDAHPGLKAALAQVLGAPWQRCTVHFLRDLRGHVRKDQHDALGAIIRSIFTAADGAQARERLRDAVGQLERRLPKIAAMLEQAEDDVLAFYAFPAEHWPKLRSTNPLERFNREIGRRTDVVGIFPDDASRDPARLDARHRSQRRMARRTQLHQPEVDGHSLRARLRDGYPPQIRKRRSSSSRPEPPTLSPTTRAPTPTPRPGT